MGSEKGNVPYQQALEQTGVDAERRAAVRLVVSAPEMEVFRLVVRPAVSVAPDTPITEAASVMRDEDVSAVLVGTDGILTEHDLAIAWADGLDGSEPVSTMATVGPVAIDGSASVIEAAGILLNSGVRHLVVLMPDGSRGIVSLRVVTAVLLQTATEEIWLETLQSALKSHSELWLG